LRDVTGTVPSQALIVASIMSKKLAENLYQLVLDVKFGSGAFMKTRKEAKQLAASMTKVGKLMGIKVSHLLSPMDEPLGRAVGNALEVAECVEILHGGGPPDVVDLVLDLAEQVSTASRAKLNRWLSDGTAWRKFISLAYAQYGTHRRWRKSLTCTAPIIHPLLAYSARTVKTMDAETIGRISFSRRRPPEGR
jgi:thymidine phosphorylase